MEVLLEVTVLFTLALALAFLIERILEILKAIYDLLDSRLDWYKFWTERTYKIRNTLENRLRIFEYVGPNKAATILNKFRDKLMNENGSYSGQVPVLSGDLVRATAIKAALKILAIGLGIALAFAMKIDLIAIWQNAMSIKTYWILDNINTQGIRLIITGIIIGLGSGPLHKFVTVIDKKRKQKQSQTA